MSSAEGAAAGTEGAAKEDFEANLTAADSGKLLAHGVATCMILGGD